MSVITASRPFGNRFPVKLAWGGAVVLLAACLATPNLMRTRMAADESRQAAFRQMQAESRSENLAPHHATSVSLSNTDAVAALNSAAPAASGKAQTVSADRKMVRTGALELIVTSPADAAEQIRLMAESMGGYLEAGQIGGTKEAPTAVLTVRVPATRFEDAKAGIRKLAARVENEKTDAQDVTRQYVDMEARLRNLRAEEAQYLAIMKGAYKVDDLIEVSQKVGEVRGEIEQQQAEFQTLSKQVETVAITVSLRAVADAQVFGLSWRPLYQLKVAARDGLDAMADYATTMTAILCYLPVILAWSLTILFAGVLGWRLFRWGSRRLVAAQAAAVPNKATGSI
ncbi:MAG TPA: DUF4349 domain-containing protein [Terriglobales bacterium]|jgi:hypothetical protein|nr:DUF4349 domain-containing protein [Terriglobales bacterium]